MALPTIQHIPQPAPKVEQTPAAAVELPRLKQAPRRPIMIALPMGMQMAFMPARE